MNNNLPIWPIQGPSTPQTYRPYQEVLIAPPNITIALLDAFAFVGLPITQPPQDLYNLLHKIQSHQLLTPELASATIMVCLYDFFEANAIADKLYCDIEAEPTCC